MIVRTFVLAVTVIVRTLVVVVAAVVARHGGRRGARDGVACTTTGAGVAACRWTTTVFVWVRTMGFVAAAGVCSDAALAVGPVMPSENAAPAIGQHTHE